VIEQFCGQIRVQRTKNLRKSILWFLVLTVGEILSACVINRTMRYIEKYFR